MQLTCFACSKSVAQMDHMEVCRRAHTGVQVHGQCLSLVQLVAIRCYW